MYLRVYPLIPDQDLIFLYNLIVFGCQPVQSVTRISSNVCNGSTILAWLFVLFIFRQIVGFFSNICFSRSWWSDKNLTADWKIIKKSMPICVRWLLPDNNREDNSFMTLFSFAGLNYFFILDILGRGLTSKLPVALAFLLRKVTNLKWLFGVSLGKRLSTKMGFASYYGLMSLSNLMCKDWTYFSVMTGTFVVNIWPILIANFWIKKFDRFLVEI